MTHTIPQLKEKTEPLIPIDTLVLPICIENVDRLISHYPAELRPIYFPLSNTLFSDCLSICGESINVSDFVTVLKDDTRILKWSLTNQDITHSISQLSIDSIYFHDPINAISVFKSQPIKESDTLLKAEVKRPKELNAPLYISYRVQFSFVFKSQVFYFQFDPLIQTRTNPV